MFLKYKSRFLFFGFQQENTVLLTSTQKKILLKYIFFFTVISCPQSIFHRLPLNLRLCNFTQFHTQNSKEEIKNSKFPPKKIVY